jgi:hypothetical protein
MITITAPELIAWLILSFLLGLIFSVYIKFRTCQYSDNWIDVKDRLPLIDGAYFVYRGTNDFDNDIFENGKFEFGNVTHWQPLIEAPVRKNRKNPHMARYT